MKSVIRSLLEHRHLVLELSRRDIESRYRGSLLGMAWPVLQPLLLLAVYTFVFTEVFKARWPGVGESARVDVAVMIFAGMIVHGFFAECIVRAPSLLTGNANYVKKVVFPLQILPWVALNAALFHAALCLAVLLAWVVLSGRGVPWTAVLLPLVAAPFVIFTIGCMWLLTALGAYLRDLGQLMTFVATLLMFASPVLYPVDSLPVNFRAAVGLNPLTFFIEATRATVLLGRGPPWGELALWCAGSFVFAWLALCWFESARGGFGDVV
jgi:lipopolysaccharide transport system permease protein